jgi:hypothetical protein
VDLQRSLDRIDWLQVGYHSVRASNEAGPSRRACFWGKAEEPTSP